MTIPSRTNETRSNQSWSIAFALFAWTWHLLCVWVSTPKLNLPHAPALNLAGGIGVTFPGFLGIHALCLWLAVRQSILRIACAMTGLTLLLVLANHSMPVFGQDGTYGGALWLFDLLACLSGTITLFAWHRLGLIKRASSSGGDPGYAMHWGVAVGLGLFVLTLLDTYTGTWAINLWLYIRSHLGLRFSALPLYFSSEAFTGLLVGLAFTWISRARKTTFLLPFFSMTLALAAYSVIANGFIVRLALWPGMILSGPLGLLAGGSLALLILRRREPLEADPESASA